MGSQRSAQLISLDDVLLIEGQPGIPQTACAEVIILRNLVTCGLPPSVSSSLRRPPPEPTHPGWGRCGLLGPFLAFDSAAAGHILWLVNSQGFTPCCCCRDAVYGATGFGSSVRRKYLRILEESRSDLNSFSLLIVVTHVNIISLYIIRPDLINGGKIWVPTVKR